MSVGAGVVVKTESDDNRAPELFPADPESVEDLLERVKRTNPDADLSVIEKAYRFSEKAHAGQFRRSGEPYIQHPLGVAAILGDLRMDSASIVTAILHDTVEDTAVTLKDIETQFGPTVRDLVDGVTKLSQMKFRNTHEKQGENIRKMIVAMGKDVRVILVKLADRLHNMRTLKHLPFEKQKRIAQETIDIYAPLAGRLGIMSIKVELEDLSFRYLHPDQFYDLAQKTDKKKSEREKYIEETKTLLARELKARTQTSFEIFGRPKHFYSIFKKISHRNVDFDQIHDLLAFRVIVGTVSECYEVLGHVHSLWKPVPGRFKDFIAMPKTNNYQSLHTTVVGPGGERIEVQIRTREMHAVAEWGIAAHWKYKEAARGPNPGHIERLAVDKFTWLRELITLHQQTNSSDEFLENIKTDLSEGEIYVFTPKGDVKELPEGATPIDFAYSVHTDVGSRIVAARVNGRIVTLKHQLKNGDSVEVITSKTQRPNKDWLKYCVTTRAKSKIRALVKEEQRLRAQELGKEILERAFRKAGASWQKVLQSSPQLEALLRDEGCSQVEDLFVRVGYGKVTTQRVIEAIAPERVAPPKEASPTFLQKVVASATSAEKKKSGSVISVDGMDDVLVRYAKCCLPIPGDAIVGFISRGRGIIVHRADCEKAYEIDQARAVDVDWTNNNASQTPDRLVRVKIVSEDQSGLLKLMSEVFASRGANIQSASARATRDLRAISLFDIRVRNTQQLNDVIRDLQKLPGVTSVTRTSSSEE
jgi:GTP diphosphokinase / guanosine-3',5'-bis(diphosphate) 3'-diphosphatase